MMEEIEGELKIKDLQMSNIKGLLIFLVVFGHLLEVYKEDFHNIYNFIYSFHMPLFILVSGYFAKRVNAKKMLNLLLIYLIFQTIYQLFFSAATMSLNLTYITPYFHLWYLLSMVMWYLFALPLKKINMKSKSKYLILFLILCVSLFSRYIPLDGYFLSYQRTLSFAFFFFLGFMINKDELDKMRTLISGNVVKWVTSIFISIPILTYITLGNTHNLEMVFRGAFNTGNLELSNLHPLVHIIICYVISTLMCLVLISLVSRKKTILTTWGDNSLYIFLFHAFFMIPLQYVPSLSNALQTVANQSILLIIILVVYTILIVVFLNSKLFRKYTAWLCNPMNTLIRLLSIQRNKSGKQAVG